MQNFVAQRHGKMIKDPVQLIRASLVRSASPGNAIDFPFLEVFMPADVMPKEEALLPVTSKWASVGLQICADA